MARLLALSLLLAGLSAGCGYQPSYEVSGRIVGFGDDDRTLIIEHGDVPGLMPGMTMSFKKAGAFSLDTLSVGDAVRFTLVLARDSSWIAALERLPDDALPQHPAGTPDPMTASAAQAAPLLQPGDPAPDAALLSASGDSLRLSDYRGRALVMTFIYTRCPMPEYCPLLSRRFSQLQPEIAARYEERAQLLSVSFDPAYDRPQVLRAYADRQNADPATWRFATGDSLDVAAFAAPFGVFYTQGEGEILHNLSTVLIDPAGRVHKIWRGTEWTTDAVLDALETVLRKEG